MIDFYRVFIIAIVLAIQYFFSTRDSIYWGAIIPVAYVVLLTGMFVTNNIESTIGFILYLLLGILFLIVEWNQGRKSLHKKRKKELDKMKTHDIR
ncbi:hypothetical protein JDS87_30980 [Bacillus cereus]|uniref:hypothetical protein n=1 Tax=Bacillus cereus TaxID=1396 RepID=UPI0018F2DB6E|nr:hypothetical protein [Bacillus cereus]MBJ8056155.1 hypothetical protein [Bacillus cereus]